VTIGTKQRKRKRCDCEVESRTYGTYKLSLGETEKNSTCFEWLRQLDQWYLKEAVKKGLRMDVQNEIKWTINEEIEENNEQLDTEQFQQRFHKRLLVEMVGRHHMYSSGEKTLYGLLIEEKICPSHEISHANHKWSFVEQLLLIDRNRYKSSNGYNESWFESAWVKEKWTKKITPIFASDGCNKNFQNKIRLNYGDVISCQIQFKENYIYKRNFALCCKIIWIQKIQDSNIAKNDDVEIFQY